MTTPTLERLARKLRFEIGDDVDHWLDDATAERVLRALLQELREPDEAMLAAAVKAALAVPVRASDIHSDEAMFEARQHRMRVAHRAMIDHLLGDPQP